MSKRAASSGYGQQVEGKRAVRELLVAGRRRVREVWLAGDGHGDVADLARAAGATVHFVDDADLARRARTGAPQGIVARAEALEPVALDALLADPAAFLVALDGVTDPQNLGAVIRSAETAGATGVVVPRHRSASVTPAVVKASAGALEYMPVATVSGMPAAVDPGVARGRLERGSRCRRRHVGVRPRRRRPRTDARARLGGLGTRPPHARTVRRARRASRSTVASHR